MATAANNASLILNISGTQSVLLKRGEKTSVIAKAGQRYRVVKEGEEAKGAAAKDVAASQQGQDLLLSYADGTQVLLVSFYEACKAEQCVVDMPGAKGTGTSGGYVITGDSAVGASLSDGGKLVYAFGDTSALTAITQGQGQGSGFAHQGGLSTYMPPSEGTSWTPLNLAVGAIGAVGAAAVVNHSKTETVPTVLRGNVVAGPVVVGNGLEVVAYKADGTLLVKGRVASDGTFELNVPGGYLGLMLVRVHDTSVGSDYIDEATNTAKDLTTDLRAAVVVTAPGSLKINVNPITELAVRKLGLAGGDNASSEIVLSGLTAQTIAATNQQLAKALGLPNGQDLVTGQAPVAVVDAQGQANPASNDYGRILAALSGAEAASDSSTVLDTLVSNLTDTGLTAQAVDLLVKGAAQVGIAQALDTNVQTLLTGALSAAEAMVYTLSSYDGTGVQPTIANYVTAGVTGVTSANLQVIDRALATLNASSTDSTAELQALVDAYSAVLAVASSGGELMPSNFDALGISGVTEDNLQAVQAALAATADDGSGVDTLAKLQALVDSTLARVWLSGYDGTDLAPTLDDFIVAGLTGVNDSNLDAINSALAALPASATGTAVDLQTVVNAYTAVLAAADGVAGNSTTAPTAAQFTALGVTGLTGNTAAATTGLLGGRIDGLSAADVDTVAELQALANAASAVVAAASGGSISLAQLQALGITGVTADNLAVVQTALAATADDGTGVDTLAEVQALVTQAQAAFATTQAINTLSQYDGSNTAPTMADYAAVGVTGVNSNNLSAINSALAGLPAKATGTANDLQIVVDAYTAVLEAALGGSVSLEQFSALGIQGTTAENLRVVQAMLAATADDASGVDTLAELQALVTKAAALYTVAQYDGTTTAPVLANFTAPGVTGVNAANLSAINSALASLPDTATGSPADLQTVVNAYTAVLAAADGGASTTTAPTAAQYAALGLTGLSGNTASATANLLGNLIDGLTSADVDTIAELQGLANAAIAVVAAASGTAISLAQLQALGISGVTADNLATLQTLLAATDDSGTGVDSLAEIQALANKAAAVFTLSNYSGTNTEPDAADYAAAGITGVTAGNLSAINSALAALPASATGTPAQLQTVVEAYTAVLAAADGTSSTAPTAAQFAALGVTVSGASNAATTSAASLLSSLIAELAPADVDTVAELQSLADAATAVVAAAAGGSVTLAQLLALGLDVTHADITAVQTALAATADDGSAVASLSALQTLVGNSLASNSGALNTISNYNGTTNAPSAADYTSAGVTGVNANNLDAINNAVAGLPNADKDSAAELQSVVQAYAAVLAAADGVAGNVTTAPTAAQYAALGVTGLTGDTASATASLLGNLIDGLSAADVDTVAELQTLANAAAAVVSAASGSPISLAQLKALGITGVTADNLATVQAMLAATADDGTGVDSLAEIQALANKGAAVFTLSDYNGINTEPQAGDFSAAGVNGVTVNNLGAINSALATLPASATSTPADLQTVVDAYSAVLAVADRTSPTAPTAEQYATLGVTGLSGNSAAASASLLGNLMGSLSRADVDTVAEIQALANAAAAVVAAASGTAINLAQLKALGIAGVTADNLATVQALLAATADDGSGLDTLAEIQALVTQAVAVYTLSAYNGSNTVPTTADYVAAGVTGVNSANLSAINSALADLPATATATSADLQSVVSAYTAVMAAAASGASVSLEQLNALGITGTTADNLSNVQALLAATADDGSGVDTLAELQALVAKAEALSTLAKYDGSNTAPILSSFAAAGVTGVNAENLSAINSALAALPASATGTAAQLQTVVDAYTAVLAAADGGASTATTAPTAAQYAALGVTGLSGNTATATANLLGNLIDGLPSADVDTLAELQSLANAASAVVAAASGGSVTQDQFKVLGIKGVTADNLATVQALLAATADDGTGVDTHAEIQTLVSKAAAVFTLSTYTGTNTEPDPADYAAAGITGVTAGNLSAINSALAALPASATGTAVQLQTVVDAYAAVLSAADNTSTTVPTAAQFAALGITFSGASNAASSSAASLMGSLIGGLTPADVDTVAELQALANAVAAVVTAAAGGSITLAQLQALGINAANVDITAVNTALAATDDSGSGVATLSALQALVNSCVVNGVPALTTISNYNGTTNAPSAADYSSAGVTGVDANNLDAINNAVAGLPNANKDSAADLQSVVEAYAAVLAAADGVSGNVTIAPTAAQYAALGVTGLTGDTASATASLLGNLIDGLTAADVDTVAELQTLANAAAAVVSAASGSPISLAQLKALGITGVTDDNLATVQALLAATADDGTGVDSLAEIQALANTAKAIFILSTYTGTNIEPTSADFTAAGLSGVNDDNLSAINSALATLPASATGTPADLQTVVDAYSAVLALADRTANTVPTAAQFAALGVTGLSGNSAAATASLLGNLIGSLSRADVDTVAEIQALANAASAVVAAASGGSVSLDQLQALGIKGVTADNLAAVQAALAGTADDGAGLDTRDEIQALVTQAAALHTLSAYTGSNAVPTTADYEAAGVTGVSTDNLSAINSALATLPANATASAAQLQTVVNAYTAVFAAATGGSVTQAQLQALGITGVTADNLATVQALISATADNGTGVDTWAEIQALVTQAAAVYTLSAYTSSNTVPTTADYAAAGVTGVNAANLSAINSALADLPATATATSADLQSVVSAYTAVLAAAASGASVSLQQLSALGITGTTADNLITVQALLAATADDGSGVDTLAELQALVAKAEALSTLANYDGSNTAPILSSFAAAGVTGVNAANLSAINSALAALPASATGTAAQLQTVVDAYTAVLAAADGGASTATTAPTAAQYAALGVTGLSGNTASATANLLGNLIDGLPSADVDTLAELQTLADAATAVVAAAAGGTITLAQLQALGIKGVTADNLPTLQALLAATDNSGTDVDSFSEIQALVSKAAAVFTLSTYNGTNTEPEAADYAAAGINGVSSDNLRAINSALAALPASATGTTDQLQTVVDAYAAVLSAADNTSTMPPRAPQFAVLGVTFLGISPDASPSAPSLLGSLIGGLAPADVDTLPELQALADAATGVVAAAAGVNITLAHLQALGINVANVDITVVNTALAATDDNGSGVATLSALQALVNSCVVNSGGPLATITNYTGITEAPSVANYASAGVTGVTDHNIHGINSVVAGLATSGKDTTAELQSVVEAYTAVLAAADGTRSNSQALPTAAQYADLGVSGLSGNTATATARLLGNVIDGLTAADVDTVAELQTLATAASAVVGAASTGSVTLDQLKALGITGVTADNLSTVQATLAASPDDGTGVDSLSEIQTLVDQASAVYTLSRYIGGKAEPQVGVYTAAGVTGVTNNNLKAINNALARLDSDVTDSRSELQAVVDAYNAVLSAADSVSANSQTLPTSAQYTTLQLYGLTGSTAAATARLLGSRIDSLSNSDVDTVDEMQTLASAARIVIRNASSNDVVTLAQLQALGITGVTSDNLTIFNKVIASTPDNGSDVDTVAEIQSLVAAANALRRISSYTGKGEPLTLSDYTTAGVTGVTVDNLSAINSAIGPITPAGSDEASEVQTVVSAYRAILAAADGTAGNSAGATASQYDALSVLGMGTSPARRSLMNSVVDKRQVADVDTVSELQALGAAVTAVIAAAAGTTTDVSVAGLQNLGITGVTTANLAAVQTALAATADDGTGVDTLTKLQTLVTGVAQQSSAGSSAKVALSAIAAGSGGFVINGQCQNEKSGFSVASAGDVNGDGLTDLIVSAPDSAPNGRASAGRSYVVFGKTSTLAIELSEIVAGSGGFAINGQVVYDKSGWSVSSAGDVNGDGLADVIIGSTQFTPIGRAGGGRSYVVFGKSDGIGIELSTVAEGNGGFVINAHSALQGSGISVSSAGDVNGDGLVDLLVGASLSKPNDKQFGGTTYVVFGKTNGSNIELSKVAAGEGGFVVNGQSAGDFSGTSVAVAGDVNGDGLSDLIVGAGDSDFDNMNNPGRSYVLFGKSSGVGVELSTIAAGTGGFVMVGQCADESSGASVAGAGDVNGDGLADLIVGAPGATPNGKLYAGRSYVIFGKTNSGDIKLSAVAEGTGGFVINGQCTDERSGYSVSAAGDMNGDGLSDLIVGAYTSSPGNATKAGSSYVVFGKTSGGAIELSAVAAGSGGFAIAGQCASDNSGFSVAGAGDVNGDGLADLIVGANRSDPTSNRLDAGRSYVIFGNTSGAFSQTSVDWLGTDSADTQSDGGVAKSLVAGAGDDSLTATAASVLYGGAGNDRFTINGTVLTALKNPMGSGGNVDQLARIDGGTGMDTLALSASGLTLNLADFAARRVQNIEVIDLTSTDNSTLALSVSDVMELGGMNQFNSSNGWTSLGATVKSHQLWVKGKAGDVLNAQGRWYNDGTIQQGNETYLVFNAAGSSAQLLVDSDITRNMTLLRRYAPMNLSDIAQGTGGFVINGQGVDNFSGTSVSSAGDVNGDGLADLIVGANGRDPLIGLFGSAVIDAGSSYVVFGTTRGTAVDLSAVAGGTGGFVINGQAASDNSGVSVSAAGDVNGDGLADLIVGANRSDPSAVVNAGRSYVVFGKNSTSTVNLADVTSGTSTLGFVINGQGASSESGISVSTAGDMNGDGLVDLIVGAHQSSPTDINGFAGRSYVVYGKTSASAVELASIAAGTGGFVIDGLTGADFSGRRVSAAGDVNGDGLADLIIGAPGADPVYNSANNQAGRVYVLFGQSSGTVMKLSAVAAGSGGFVINGEGAENNLGQIMGAAGDVNGDGLTDLIMGVPSLYSSGGMSSGRSYVVFGKSTGGAVNLSAVTSGTGGFIIDGNNESDRSGASVSAAGDMNGDGLGDLIVGATGSNAGTVVDAGRSYVVFGKTDSTGIKLSNIVAGSGGFVINGQCRDDSSGNSVSAAGDVNGDGLADLIVGAYSSDPLAGSSAGRSYVIFGNTVGAFSESMVDWLGTAAAETQSDGGTTKTLAAGAGDDTLTGTAASVLYGGAGNDKFIMNATMSNALQSPMGMGGNVNRLSRIDGGSGMDTLALSESGQMLSLSGFAATRVQSIEVVDLAVAGANVLQVSTGDVAQLADMNLINSATAGWAAGTYTLAATERFHQLVVQGNAADVLLLKGAWTSMGTVTSAGVAHAVYTNSATREQLLVQNTVRVVRPGPVELSAVANGQDGFVINGQCANDASGFTVSSAGDVNGDGLDDLIIGAKDAEVPGLANTSHGRAYVVFGQSGSTAINLSAVAAVGSTLGFVINGSLKEDFAGSSVSGAGDVNGDGKADIIVGSPGADSQQFGAANTNTGWDGGRAYVIFGKTDGAAVNLLGMTTANSSGFLINGVTAGDGTGNSVAAAGDVNGDGFADVLVGAKAATVPDADAFGTGNQAGAGRAYVVFGKADNALVYLSSLVAPTASGGFVVNGRFNNDYAGIALAGGADINGDGLDDVVIGADGADTVLNAQGTAFEAPGWDGGQAYVVFGKTSTSKVNTMNIAATAGSTDGFLINGLTAGDFSGTSVELVSDINGDGLADILVGAKGSDVSGNSSGRAYVIFGKTDNAAVQLSAVAQGSGGFAINGQGVGTQAGFSVAALGDLNADGLADYLVGAPNAGGAGVNSGLAYVVFGRSGTQAIELSEVALGVGGFVIKGQSENDTAGFSVSAAGDLNGDGFTELLVSTPGGDPTGATNAGRSYVIWGNNPNVTTSGSLDLRQTHGDASDDSRNDNGQSASFVTGMGNDTLTASAASVLYAGKGNDLIRVSGAMLTGLENAMGSGGNTARLARIDGGEGVDTLALLGGEQHLNFSQIQQSGSWPRMDGIEVIDLVGTGDNVFSPTAQGVMGLGGRNIFNSASGWTGLSNTSDKYQVRVEGNAGDWVNLPAGWTLAGQATWQNSTYNIYNSGKAQMLVNSPVIVSDDLPPTVQSVALTAATGAAGAWLNAGDTVTATVTFSEVVKVNTTGGTPTLALDVGGTTVLASYSGGSNSGALTFTATLANGLNDADGISIGANGLALNGGAITDLTRSVGSLAHAQVGLNAAYKVDTAVAEPNTSALEGVLVAPTNVEAGATVEYRIATLTGGFGSWRTDLAGIQPATNGSADGRYQVQTRQTDVAGNVAVQTMKLDVGRFYAPIELSAVAAGVDGFVINGVKPESGQAYDYGDMSGYSVSSAGDVNGDGLADVILGAQYADGTDSYQINSGRSYVVFGKSDGSSVNLSQVAAGTGGFVIDGYTQGDQSGISVSGAGDVNGDGLADLIVGAGNRGSCVVFGKTSGSVVQVADIAYRGGTGGFFIEGIGLSIVNAAGDVNGDGLADLIVGAPDQDYLYAGVVNKADAGRSYVVFGKASLGSISLNTVAAGTGGFVINGIFANDRSGSSVSAAGDVNGDGLADLIVGAPSKDNDLNLSNNVGTSYIVFGKTSTNAVELFESGLGRLEGYGLNVFSGASVSAAGDVNGDGLADVIVGAWGGTPLNPTRNGAGQSYVVFGQTTNDGWQTNLIAEVGWGGKGFVINGESSGDGNDELSVSGAGDINGDGLADLIVGAGASDPTLARTGAGRSYVVYGKTNDNKVELSAVAAGVGGFVINGDAANDTSGVSVSAAGDVNGDGLADLLVGAHKANNFAGKSYVIFGGTNGAFQKSAVDWLGTSGDDTQSDGGQAKTLVGGAGNDALTATGASVLYGGAGNDTFNIDANMITALQSPLGRVGNNLGQLARIDGGGGLDTIVLSGAGLTLDLTQVANQAASNPDGGSRIDSVEKIDLTGSGDNMLKLQLRDVLDMGSANLFQTTGRQQLLVKGNAGDTVDLADATGTAGWTLAGSNVALEGVNYAVWNHDTSKATVYVQTGVVVN
ncbi:FG-GAP repeat [Burkholderiaceae bacterium]